MTEDKESGAVDVLRTIKRFKKLFDVSAVSMPANDATGCNVTLRLDSGTTQTFSIGTSASAGAKATLYYLYVCSGGAYISTVSNAYLGLIISNLIPQN